MWKMTVWARGRNGQLFTEEYEFASLCWASMYLDHLTVSRSLSSVERVTIDRVRTTPVPATSKE